MPGRSPNIIATSKHQDDEDQATEEVGQLLGSLEVSHYTGFDNRQTTNQQTSDQAPGNEKAASKP